MCTNRIECSTRHMGHDHDESLVRDWEGAIIIIVKECEYIRVLISFKLQV